VLFDRIPKYKIEEFYAREEELQLLFKGLEVGEGLIVVYGVRRVGKTSLVQVGLTEYNVPYVIVDLRRFSEDPSLLSPSVLASIVKNTLKEYEKYSGKVKKFAEKILDYINSLDLKVIKLEVKGKRSELLVKVLEDVDKWAKKRNTRFVIVLDEAQELKIIPAWRKILAWALDTLENVTFIVTGSEVGVLKDFLRLDDRNSPLFGRARLEIYLKKFGREAALDFLKRGFQEVEMKVVEEELVDAVNRLDGIVGWLALYGYYRVSYNLPHNSTIERVEADAIELIAGELEKLVKFSPKRYLAILWAITLGLKTWSTIKHYAEGIVGHIPDNKYDRLLKNLVKYGFIEKTENLEYRVIDPLLPKAVEKLLRKHRIIS